METDLRKRVAVELGRLGIPDALTDDLLRYFSSLVKECQTHDLEKSSIGKFVETIVQIFQALDAHRSRYDKTVTHVDKELVATYESRQVRGIGDEARVAIVRVARSMYTLRSKRSMVHKNQIDPNLFDLRYALQSAQWIMTELVRLGGTLSIENANALVEQIQRPVIPVVEVIFGRPLVLHEVTVEEEILLVLGELYAREDPASRYEIGRALDRRSAGAVTNGLLTLRARRLLEGDSKNGFRLTQTGLQEARWIAERVARDQTTAAVPV